MSDYSEVTVTGTTRSLTCDLTIDRQPTTAPETLRDRFAMAALTGLTANPANREPADVFAKAAYDVADAMMEARK